LRCVVVGAGMAGILATIRLREAGFDDVTVYEKDARLGGTWRDNTYPGVACDVPSHLYCFSFSPNPGWSHDFSPGAEICRYLEEVAERFDVARDVRFDTEVTGMAFERGRWQIETSNGLDVADVVVAATGVLRQPSIPDIEGLETFSGPVFHSARWDHGVRLEGSRLGVVGTGSSAVQITAAVVDQVRELHLFQRTAQWVLTVPNEPIDAVERARLAADPAAMLALRAGLSTFFEESFANVVVDAASPGMAHLEEACRTSLEEGVRDPVLRERLRPDYRAACKRLVVSPNFYDAIQRDNAHLVTERIARIEPDGVRTVDGELHALDVLALATGFRVDRFLRPMQVVGEGGVALDEVWAERPSAYLAVSVPGFPNLFLLNGPNGPVGNFSLIEVAELQMGYVLQLLEELAAGRCARVSATRDAAERFEASRVEAAQRTVWVTGCRSWYLDDRGIPAAWPWTFDRFRSEMASPRLEDFDLVP
jgi:cation diffusion facilitator CzcD-associated flavoprotein CzcO